MAHIRSDDESGNEYENVADKQEQHLMHEIIAYEGDEMEEGMIEQQQHEYQNIIEEDELVHEMTAEEVEAAQREEDQEEEFRDDVTDDMTEDVNGDSNAAWQEVIGEDLDENTASNEYWGDSHQQVASLPQLSHGLHESTRTVTVAAPQSTGKRCGDGLSVESYDQFRPLQKTATRVQVAATARPAPTPVGLQKVKNAIHIVQADGTRTTATAGGVTSGSARPVIVSLPSSSGMQPAAGSAANKLPLVRGVSQLKPLSGVVAAAAASGAKNATIVIGAVSGANVPQQQQHQPKVQPVRAGSSTHNVGARQVVQQHQQHATASGSGALKEEPSSGHHTIKGKRKTFNILSEHNYA